MISLLVDSNLFTLTLFFRTSHNPGENIPAKATGRNGGACRTINGVKFVDW